MTHAICLSDVTFGYSKHEAVLKNASCVVNEGEFVAVIGPNGGGKTTLLRLIMGFLSPWKGSITLFESEIKKYRTEIAYVPQNLRCDKQFPITVFELVLGGKLRSLSLFRGYSDQVKEEALLALRQVGLERYANRSFGTLSGGQAQRALIARALVQHPKILLLDEPTANVDAEAEVAIYELLQELRKDRTVVMVTHDIRAVIKNTRKVLCVQGSIETVDPQKLCEHFALGLYHYPLIQTPETHLSPNNTKTRFGNNI